MYYVLPRCKETIRIMNSIKRFSLYKTLVVLFALCFLYGLAPGTSSATLLLRLNKSETEMIQGDCTIPNYEGWITVTSFSQAINRELSESAKAGTTDIFTGVAEFEPLVVTKTLDKSSPYLNLAASNGQVFDSLRLELIVTSTTPTDPVRIIVYTLKKVIVSSITISSDEDGRPTEQVSFMFQQIVWEYYTYKADGKLDKIIKTGWDCVARKSIP